ncbi:MAG TPA: VOC family protein [Actinomycetota bacterium]|jgi:catechol 2,3-dioxygenase-like lactoylglutathione lyase family enzyme
MPEFSEASATLPVADLNRAKGFYEGTLGLSSVMEDPGGILYSAGSAHVFVYPSEFAGSNRATAATFVVADTEAAVEELRGKGVVFEEYDQPGLKTENGIAEVGGVKGAWFKDTEGNILALTEMPPMS